MRLDRQAQAALDHLAGLGPAPRASVTPALAREHYRTSRRDLQAPAPAVANVTDHSIDGPGGVLRLRHYRPAGGTVVPAAGATTATTATTVTTAVAALPGIVWFHGGGWTTGDLDTHDTVCRELANASRAVVVAVDYRLAPEHRFPAAVDDAIAATAWVADHAVMLGIDPALLAVAGDSAGGNLAAVVALDARDRGKPFLRGQALVYPALDFRMKHASHRAFATGYGLGAAALADAREAYLRNEADIHDWRASPLLVAELAGVAPAYILTAGFDPLRDEGEAYAERLHAAGVAVTYECFEGMIHGFLLMGGAIASAGHAIHRIALGLRQSFGLVKPPAMPRGPG